MDDEWDDSPAPFMPAPPQNNYSSVDEGHCVGRGRGFTAFTPCYYDGGNDEESTNGYGGTRRSRGGRVGPRGGRGDRGGGGRGRGGGREPRRDYDNDGGGDYDGERGDREERWSRGGRGGRGERGGGRGGGRGGRGGYTNGDGDGDNDRNSKPVELDENGEPKKPPVTYVPPEPTCIEEEMFGTNITTGINFDKFDHIAIKVTGENPPGPIDSFESAGLRKYVLDNVKKSGYKKPTPIQKYAIPIIMAGRDLMGCAQTGSGKTAAFLVPIINTLLERSEELVVGQNGCAQPQVVIISPTRELTLQIFQEARKFSHNSILKVAVAYGGTAVRYQGDKIASGCHILVATPGRLQDFVDRNRVSFQSVRFIVLDEADRMLDMGFLPNVEKMMEHPTMVEKSERNTLMFSATFPEDIQLLAGRFLHQYLFVAVGIVGGASTDVDQVFMEVSRNEKKPMLLKFIQENENKRMLVFVETRRNTDFLASYLSENKRPTSSIHGDRLQQEREEALHQFKSGACSVLVATAVAARGLDIKNVDIVFNYDLPKSIDEYVHRIGRTGRLGNRGKAVSFFDPEKDLTLVTDLAKILRQAGQKVPEFLEATGASSYQPTNNYGADDVRDFIPTSAPGTEAEELW